MGTDAGNVICWWDRRYVSPGSLDGSTQAKRGLPKLVSERNASSVPGPPRII